MASKMAIWMVDKRERTNTCVVLCIRIARVFIAANSIFTVIPKFFFPLRIKEKENFEWNQKNVLTRKSEKKILFK